MSERAALSSSQCSCASHWGVRRAGTVLALLLGVCVAFWAVVVLAVRALAIQAGISPWLCAIGGLLAITLLAAGLMIRDERRAKAAEDAAWQAQAAAWLRGGRPQ